MARGRARLVRRQRRRGSKSSPQLAPKRRAAASRQQKSWPGSSGQLSKLASVYEGLPPPAMSAPAPNPVTMTPVIMRTDNHSRVTRAVVAVGRVAVAVGVIGRTRVAVAAVPVSITHRHSDSDPDRNPTMCFRAGRGRESETSGDHGDQEKSFPIHLFYTSCLSVVIELKVRRKVSRDYSSDAGVYDAFPLTKISLPIRV
jgi:hypothetical protein